jgi:transcriptional regulator with XRE-family HTH domain
MKLIISCIIGKRIRQIRISQSMSMITLANVSDMEYIQLSRIERGQINTSLFQIYKITKALNIRLDALFNGIDEDVLIELQLKNKI